MNLFKQATYPEQFKAIVTWNKIINGGEHVISDDKINLQWALIEEEAIELYEAFASGDSVQTVHELCDNFVVLSYQMVLQHLKIFENLSIDLKFLDNYYPVPAVGVETFDGLDFTTALNYYISAVRDMDHNWAWTALHSMMFALNVDVAKCLNKVIQSNYSKFCTVEQLKEAYGDKDLNFICKAESESIMSSGRYKDVTSLTISIDGVQYVLFKSDDGNGKLVKPSSFEKADVSDLVA